MPAGHGAGVLIRAIEPTAGVESMRERRRLHDVRLLCAGPGRVCQALGVTREHDGLRLDRKPFRIVAAPPSRGSPSPPGCGSASPARASCRGASSSPARASSASRCRRAAIPSRGARRAAAPGRARRRRRRRRERRRQRRAADQRGARFAHRRRGLDAVAALRRRARRSRRRRRRSRPTRSPSATNERRPAQVRVRPPDRQRRRRARCGRSPSATSSSSGCTSCGSTGSALAGEPSSMPASGLKYQLSSTPTTTGQRGDVDPSGGAKMKAVRRRGYEADRRARRRAARPRRPRRRRR